MNILKEKLKNHEPLAGAHVILTDPCISEIVSNLDYDFILIDTEHSAIDYRTLEMHLMAVRAGGTPAVVRVPWNDPILVKRVLEQGPDGIVFPVINTAEEARQAMESCLYPPEGKRGFGPIRAVKYGLEDMDGYIRTGHKELCRLIQIESKEGVRNLDEILCNPYIDGVIIGACDLSGSIGILNQVFDERNLKLIDEAVQTAERHQVPIGISTGSTDPETLKFWYDRGLTILSSGMDYSYILSGARQTLDTIRTVFGSSPCA